jgi:hypothetical protein
VPSPATSELLAAALPRAEASSPGPDSEAEVVDVGAPCGLGCPSTASRTVYLEPLEATMTLAVGTVMATTRSAENPDLALTARVTMPIATTTGRFARLTVETSAIDV